LSTESARYISISARSLGTPGLSRGTEPLIILTFACGGAELLRSALARDPDLACTWGTGALPLCRQATMVWRRAEGGRRTTASLLARKSVYTLISAQISMILADAGKRRWCETALSPTECAESFLEIFPNSKFICFHRNCAGMISAGMRSGFGDIVMRERGYSSDELNSLASYWAYRSESLLAFEAAHPDLCQRVLYEDLESRGAEVAWHALDALTLTADTATSRVREGNWPVTSTDEIPAVQAADIGCLTDGISPELRERIESVLSELGYPPLAQDPPS
jgi:hypothetical protein